MLAGKPKPNKVLKLRWKRSLPKRPAGESLGMRRREFSKRYSKVPNAFKYANFRISSLAKSGISGDAALVQVMKELHSNPTIRPYLGNEKYGWILEVTAKKDSAGTWRKPTIYKNPKIEWEENNNHDSAYEDMGGRRHLEETHKERPATVVRQVVGVTPGKIMQVKNILERLEKVSGPRFGDLRHAREIYVKSVGLVLDSRAGGLAAREANKRVANASKRGAKAEFTAIIRYAKELAELAEKSLNKNRK